MRDGLSKQISKCSTNTNGSYLQLRIVDACGWRRQTRSFPQPHAVPERLDRRPGECCFLLFGLQRFPCRGVLQCRAQLHALDIGEACLSHTLELR